MKDKIPKIVKKFDKKLPKFPDGRIDYSNSKKAATTVVFPKHENEVLILRRSNNVKHRKNKWGVVAGFLDELKPLVKKSLEELEEETGITDDIISSIIIGDPYKFEKEGTSFISHPILTNLKTKPEVKISWEHEEYKWIKITDADDFLPDFAKIELKMLLEKEEMAKN